jgi:alginate O-acetyltransferase complex protein AlgI
VYIPLGGNRRGKCRQIFNLLAVWFLTGLWHGASWNFVLWGLYYFVLLMLEKTFLLKLLDKLPKFIRHVYTLITVVFGWLLFVSTDFAAGLSYLATMFGGGRAAGFIDAGGAFDWISSLILLAILVIASTPYPKKLLYKLWEKYDAPVRTATAVLSLAVLFLAVAYLVNSSYNPFLYYRF